VWAAIGLSAAAAVVVGVRLNRPRRALPWLLLAAALAVFVLADTAASFAGPASKRTLAASLFVDALYLVMFILLLAGLTGLVRSGNTGRNRASLIDAATVSFAVGLILWIYLVSPRVGRPDSTGQELLVAVGYPLADILILAIVIRLVTSARWTPAVGLLVVGGVAMFVGDLVYLLVRMDRDWQAGGAVDLTWIVFYATWGAAALHPTMVDLTEPRMMQPHVLTKRRLALLTVCSLSAPAVLMIESIEQQLRFGKAIAAVSALMFVLVLVRLLDAMRANRLALARERGLREAGATLVAATDEVGVTAAVRAAMARLLPPAADHRLMLAVGVPTEPIPGGSDLVYTRALPAGQAERLAGFELTLRCPLRLVDSRRGETDIGTLLLASEEQVLASLEGALEVLASQAALALERISLNEEINLRDSEAYFRTLVLNTADVVLIIDEDGTIRYASPSAQAMFGRPPVTGTHLLDLVGRGSRPAAEELLRHVCSGTPPPPSTEDWTVLGPDGRPVAVEATIRDLRADPTVRGLVATLHDVTEQRQLQEELEHRAFHDSLTGLANRTLFTERAAQAVDRCRIGGTVAGVLVIDLDDFKVVNDTLGHPAGDELLEAVAQRLTNVLRPGDTGGRLGGDEFAALIEDAGDTTAIEQVAERIVGALSTPFAVGDNLVSGVASIGVATTLDASDADELLRQADLALYVAKGAGKGRWRRYQPALHAAIVERMQMRAELDKAVATHAFTLRFQPVVGLKGGDTIGFEALVRWEHPTRGTLLPGEFIEVAEETGQIVEIGNQVLARAVAAAATWHHLSRAGDAPYVSINVSARQFRTSGFIQEIRTQLAGSGLPPDRLLLEITESLLLRDDELIWEDLAHLRRLGVRVAIDDFGTGYSSLSYLRQVPLDVVKIDRSFIGAVGSSPQQRALVRGIVQLAHTLGLEVIAEGIETAAERDILVEAGCPYGQGHYYSQPLRLQQAIQWQASDTMAA